MAETPHDSTHDELRKIRLNLARTKDRPQGSAHHGYEFVAPLDASHHIDPDGWHKHRSECRVRRFWGDEADEHGHLVRLRGGSWAFHYDLEEDPDEDEAGYKFQSHAFEPGEYVSVRDEDGELQTFQVVSVEHL